MRHKRHLSALLLLLVTVTGSFGIAPVRAQTADDLENQIKTHNERLEQLNKEIQQTQNTLNQVQQQKSSLQREVKSLDTSIRQLDLNIQADTIATRKLGFEITSLSSELQNIGESINSKQETVGRLFRELQKAEDSNVVLTLLAGRSLSDILSDMQSLESLRTQLSMDVSKLNELSESYKEKLGIVSTKKTEVEIRQENLKNRKEVVEDQKQTRQEVLEVTKNQEAVYQQKITQLKKEQDSLQDQIDRIESQLNKNFNSTVLPTPGRSVLSWPVGAPRITQRFGEKSSLYRGKPHNGMDLGVPLGTPVMAAADGVVMAADNNDQSAFRKYQYGKHVVLKHPNNLATLYAHLSRYIVSPGQSVKRGEIIGYSGNTGYSTGPHLHFGLYWAPTIELKRIPPAAGLVPVGVVLDPQDYL